MSTNTIQESINVVVDDQSNDSSSHNDDDGVDNVDHVGNLSDSSPKSQVSPKLSDLKPVKDHPQSRIIGDPLSGVKTGRQLETICSHLCFTSTIEPSSVNEAFTDVDWINAMQDEINQCTRNEVQYLVPKPADKNAIRTKWIFKNKLDEFGTIV